MATLKEWNRHRDLMIHKIDVRTFADWHYPDGARVSLIVVAYGLLGAPNRSVRKFYFEPED